MEVEIGLKLIDKMNRVLKVIGSVEQYYILRYKRAMPFLVHKNQLNKYLESGHFRKQLPENKPLNT